MRKVFTSFLGQPLNTSVLDRPQTRVPRRRRLPPGNGRSGTAVRCYGTSLSSLFGEPVPALVTTFEVAPFTRAVATAAGVAEVWLAR